VKIECAVEDELTRLSDSAPRRFEEHVLDATGGLLSEAQKARLAESLSDADPVTGFTGLRADPGQGQSGKHPHRRETSGILAIPRAAGGTAWWRRRCRAPVVPQTCGQ
jgi:hypothetical protein